MKPMKRYLIILLFIGIGIGFGIGFGAVFYHIRKKKDDQITMGGSIKNIIIPSIFFWVTIGILIIVKMEYCIPLQLFILSAIVLAGFLSAISTKKAWMFFLCFGVVVLELGIEALIRRFVEWINYIMDKKKAAIIGNIPDPSAPPINSLNFQNQKNISNAFQPSAPPMNNSLKPSAPPENI
jgi:diacylglycerol kinase